MMIRQGSEIQLFCEGALHESVLKSLFLTPRSVAFIGVPRKSGPGWLNPVDNLKNWGYEGAIHLVHPHVSEIAGLKTVKRISRVEAPVDLAVVSTPRETIPGIVEECAQRAIRAVVVTNQGFAEADQRGAELERDMIRAARTGGVRILGPNTLGVSNAFDRFNSSFMPLHREELPIGLICQSGVFFVGASHLVGGMGLAVDLGNACDLDLTDALEWLGCDSRLKVIALHAETVSGGRRFLEAASEVSKHVPVVALKTGRSPEGARAAASHTGAMAAEDRLVEVVLRKAGILRVTDTDEMVDLVKGFVRLPPMRGPRVAVVTLTGAGGIIVLDAMQAAGLQPAQLDRGTLDSIQGLSPPWMNLTNPTDLWPAVMKHGMKTAYATALRDALEDPGVDGVLCLALALEPADQARLSAIDVIRELSEESSKPVLAWLYGPQRNRARDELEQEGRALAVPSLERGVRLLGRMAQYEQWRQNISRGLKFGT